MHDVNMWAAPVAALSSFALGGIWYSPLAFGKPAARELQKNSRPAPASSPRILLGSFIFTLIESFAFAWLLGAFLSSPSGDFAFHTAGWHPGIVFGLVVGGFFVTAGSGINYLFTGRSMGLLLVDGGFHVARYTLYGLVLGSWQ